MRIISQVYKDRTLTTTVEGLAGVSYEIGLANAGLAASVSGAKLESGRLKLVIPDGTAGEYLRTEISIRTR